MNDSLKTSAALVEELAASRRRIAELETIEAQHRKSEEDLRQAHRILQLVLDTLPQRVFCSQALRSLGLSFSME